MRCLITANRRASATIAKISSLSWPFRVLSNHRLEIAVNPCKSLLEAHMPETTLTTAATPKTKPKPVASGSGFEVPRFEMPKFEMPKFEMPKMEAPAAFREIAEKGLAQAKDGYEKMKTAVEEATDVFEPIAVHVVSERQYTDWLAQAKQKFAQDDDHRANPNAIAAAGGSN